MDFEDQRVTLETPPGVELRPGDRVQVTTIEGSVLGELVVDGWEIDEHRTLRWSLVPARPR